MKFAETFLCFFVFILIKQSRAFPAISCERKSMKKKTLVSLTKEIY